MALLKLHPLLDCRTVSPIPDRGVIVKPGDERYSLGLKRRNLSISQLRDQPARRVIILTSISVLLVGNSVIEGAPCIIPWPFACTCDRHKGGPGFQLAGEGGPSLIHRVPFLPALAPSELMEVRILQACCITISIALCDRCGSPCASRRLFDI